MEGFTRAALARYWPVLFLLATVLLPLYIFGQVAEEIWKKGGFVGDVPILRFINRHASPPLDTAMLFFSRIGAPVPMLLFFLVIIAALVLWRRRGDALFFAIAVGGAMAVNYGAKLLFRRDRPDLWKSLAVEHDYSFPSGHAMGSMAVVAALIILAWPTRWRWPVVTLGGLFVLLVGISRLYLGVHFPSDVLAGWSASLAWVAGVRAARVSPIRQLWQPTPRRQPGAESG